MENELPKRIEMAYRDALDNLIFLKKQQWAVTGYVLAVYGALFSARVAFKTNNWNWMFSVAAIITALAGILVVCSLDQSMNKMRVRLKWIYQNYFSDSEREGMELKPSGRLITVSFRLLFIFFIVGGAVVLLVGICHLPL